MKKSLTIFLILILSLFLLTLIIFFSQRGVRTLSTDSYLYLDLSGPIPETYAGTSPFSKELTLRDIYRVIQKGKTDTRVRGLYLKISYPQIGWGKAEEIRRLIFSFKKTGKKVVAFIEYGGDLDYFLATSADKIYTFPGSFIELNGIAGERLYYKEFFHRIGVKPQFFHIGKWKTAVNSYTEDKMTEEERTQIKRLGKGIMDFYISEIERTRGIKKGKILQFMNEEGGGIGQEFLKTGLFDGVEDEGEVLEKEFKGLSPIRARKYSEMGWRLTPNKIAVVFIEGTINIGPSGFFPFTGKITGSDTIRNILAKVKKDNSIKAVVVRINSPGGSAIASEEIERAVKKLSIKKPVIVSMSSYAASGGYYIAVDGAKILANNLTLTGSIGIIGGKLSLRGTLEKLGIKVDSVSFTKTALMDSPFKPYNEHEFSILKKRMLAFYNLFLKRVAEGRNKSVDYIDSIGRGRVFLGLEAVKNGLIDRIGGLEDSINEAAKLAGLKFYSVEFYPKRKPFWKTFLQLFQAYDYSYIKAFLKEGVYFFIYPYYQFN